MKLNQLTFTRFIAALAIVIFHAIKNLNPLNYHFVIQLFSKANLGVSYFFILSGFVMVIAYGTRGNKIEKTEYYLNRVARIYPVYIIALILSILLTFRQGLDIKSVLLLTTALQAWVPSHALDINPPAWSLSVEFLFYFSFPFLFNFFYKKYNLQVITVVTVTVWVISQIVFNYLVYSPFYKGYPSPSHNLLFYFPLLHLNQFMIGNLFGFIFLKSKRQNYDLIVLALAIIIVMFLWFDFPLNFHDGLMAFVFAAFILTLSLNTGVITKLFSNKICIILGEISYSMYILQSPIKGIINRLFLVIHVNNQPALNFACYLLVLLTGSLFCYYLIELPSRKLIKSWYSRKPVSTTV